MLEVGIESAVSVVLWQKKIRLSGDNHRRPNINTSKRLHPPYHISKLYGRYLGLDDGPQAPEKMRCQCVSVTQEVKKYKLNIVVFVSTQ